MSWDEEEEQREDERREEEEREEEERREEERREEKRIEEKREREEREAEEKEAEEREAEEHKRKEEREEEGGTEDTYGVHPYFPSGSGSEGEADGQVDEDDPYRQYVLHPVAKEEAGIEAEAADRQVHMFPVMYFTIPAPDGDIERLRSVRLDIAARLVKEGFGPGDWYASWRRAGTGVWLVMAGRTESRTKYEKDMVAYLVFRSAPPNDPVDVGFSVPESQAKVISENIKPEVKALVESMGCKVVEDPDSA